MKSLRTLFFLIVLAGLFSCQAQPEPIQYGVDNCYFCKMTQMDEKFGCELITQKGKIFKFDDLICMNRFLRAGSLPRSEVKQLLTIQYQNKGSFLPVEKAVFLVADYIVSPMGSKVAAFDSNEAAQQFMAGRPGEIKTWSVLEKSLF